MNRLTHRISTALALALALGAMTAPGAQARSDRPPASKTPAQPAAVRVVRVTDHTGFDWGDAGIGAGGMAGLIAIGVGATLAGGDRRSRINSPRTARGG
jgi:hypothetical protein